MNRIMRVVIFLIVSAGILIASADSLIVSADSLIVSQDWSDKSEQSEKNLTSPTSLKKSLTSPRKNRSQLVLLFLLLHLVDTLHDLFSNISLL